MILLKKLGVWNVGLYFADLEKLANTSALRLFNMSTCNLSLGCHLLPADFPKSMLAS